jgi:hypothetical protein
MNKPVDLMLEMVQHKASELLITIDQASMIKAKITKEASRL